MSPPHQTQRAEGLKPSTHRLLAITLAWCALLLALYVQGRTPKGTLVPAMAEFYYAFEATFLPAIVFLQWLFGCAVLKHGNSGFADAPDEKTVANALFASASCFVLPDLVLFLSSRLDLLSLWARVAGPLALLVMIIVLHRGTRSWGLTLRVTLALALPALLFVR